MKNLTQKTKASDLVLEYLPIFGIWNKSNFNKAKKCAIIAVDLVLKTNTFWAEDCGNTPEETEEYWKQVKIEIENL